MSFVALEGSGLWLPVWSGYMNATPLTTFVDTIILDADEEEMQLIGRVTIDGGGTKTFGTSSKIGWHVGAAVLTFAAGATLRVGVKQAAKIDMTSGPPARATLGAAAFDVWDDLVGGTDTLTLTTWREETMSAGTPLTVTDRDWLAVCFHLDVASGTPSIRLRHGSSAAGTGAVASAVITLVTAGPTYAGNAFIANLILAFDDGTLGWFEPCRVFSTIDTATATLGEGNSLANIVQVPFPCQIDAVAAYFTPSSAAADVAVEVLGTPLSTPTVLATVAVDANVLISATARSVITRLPTPLTLTANTAYAISLKQTTANGVTGTYWETPNAAYFKPMGMGAHCYAANSTGGATFVVQNSGLRRYLLWMRVSALDDGTGGEPSAGGGGSVFGAGGGVVS